MQIYERCNRNETFVTFFLEETVSRAYGITDNPATLAEG
jgi:hypothetical protein